MSNVYRTQEEDPQIEEERLELVPGDEREQGLTLAMAAANANLQLVSGVRDVPNPENKKKPFKQPFWFVHERGELTGVYQAAGIMQSHDLEGKLLLLFRISEAKEKLRNLLVNYYATGAASEMSIVQFGGARGFTLKTANPIPKSRSTRR